MYRSFGKRLFDIAVASAIVVLLAPVLVLVALAVRVRLGSPVIFRQARPGLHGTPFTILKFRTMTDARDASGVLLPDAERLPLFGRLLRSTSVDELPELLNVIRGDMSLVGPRPLLLEYLPIYTPAQQRRHEVRPGITGLAQVSGRNGLTWERRFELDVAYVEGHSFRMDLGILFVTLLKLFTREGISQPGHATASPFTGGPRQ